MATSSSVRTMETPTPRITPVNEPDIELDALHPQLHQTHPAEAGFSLPPVDGGKDAWLFLFSAFVLEILTWGFPFAFGIFQEYYSSNPPFAGSRNITLIGTCALGVMYLSSPFVFALFAWYPSFRRPCISVGLVLMCLSLGLSSLCQTVPHLIVTQGFFYAIGASMCYSPAILFMDEWFVKRKGLAFGIMWAGTGIGGVIIPLLLQYLLGRYGFRTTLRVWTAVLFVTTLPLTVYVRPRLPIAQVTNRRRLDLSFVRNKSFLLLQLGNVLQGFGYFVPSIYLPTFARTLGASSTVSAVTLILVNVATVFGSLTMGGIVDHWHITTCILLSTVGSTLSVFLLWGFSTNLSLLLVFCAAYGFFAGSYATTYPGIMKVLSKSERTTDSTMVFALLVAGRGIGNVACGPVTEALITVGEIGDRGLYASEYGPLVVFTGISAALGGVSYFGRTLGWY
ncbi:MFS-1 multi-domain protein [Pyrenophora tritici-repentis]|nr:MFS-1 multi-domain protein [Pyrenophora tritici-repentis]KAI1523694.1 MFS-1 multi-domain protein [Pyrenophora tritici-repentis]KAI1550535.1 MFS-1 multi-domain protein [Pyrenophora tritici-repentis]KAI1582105.1 MFS-1 multi-domain protein [Pyrenophora tritici-repentis]KAI1590149.1 MFS-1 multi-domain protein [Pyrenophora tritici-repentis]